MRVSFSSANEHTSFLCSTVWSAQNPKAGSRTSRLCPRVERDKGRGGEREKLTASSFGLSSNGCNHINVHLEGGPVEQKGAEYFQINMHRNGGREKITGEKLRSF